MSELEKSLQQLRLGNGIQGLRPRLGQGEEEGMNGKDLKGEEETPQ